MDIVRKEDLVKNGRSLCIVYYYLWKILKYVYVLNNVLYFLNK